MDTSKPHPTSSTSGQRPPAPLPDDHDGLVLLSGRDLRQLLKPAQAIDALRQAYLQLASCRQDKGQSLGFAIDGGSIHVKAGLLPGSRRAFAAKVNVNLPNNWTLRRLPTIQGAVLLVDAIDGRPLAVMESMTLTALRTAAATALAATFGARRGSSVLAVIGCGVQAHYQVEALSACFPIEAVRVHDIDPARAEGCAAALGALFSQSTAVASVAEAVVGADICVTCTTSKTAVLTSEMELSGCFVAAVGADNPEKQEIDPALMARARILVDDLEQCATGGDLAHALRAGLVAREDVCADLAQLVASQAMGRRAADDLVIFDSTGSGIQDVAAAWAAYQAARAAGLGARFAL
jgi:ornithine cyclodeaminase/alanine dehydrogenase-like protein (mu-crystallin family)